MIWPLSFVATDWWTGDRLKVSLLAGALRNRNGEIEMHKSAQRLRCHRPAAEGGWPEEPTRGERGKVMISLNKHRLTRWRRVRTAMNAGYDG